MDDETAIQSDTDSHSQGFKNTDIGKELIDMVLQAEHLSNDDRLETVNHLMSLTGTDDFRFTDNLVNLARHGIITNVQANEFVQKLELPAIELFVSPDLHAEPYWTIDMCVAWIVWRDDRQVCNAWPEFMQSVSRWRRCGPSDGGADDNIPRFELYTQRPGTIPSMKVHEEYEESEEPDNQKLLSVDESFKSLLNAIKSGELKALALNDSGTGVFIEQEALPYLEWLFDANHKFYFHHTGNGQAYTDIKLSSVAITKKWEKQKANSFTPPQKVKIRECMAAEYGRKPKSTRKQMLNHVHRELPFAEHLTVDMPAFKNLNKKARLEAGLSEHGQGGRPSGSG